MVNNIHPYLLAERTSDSSTGMLATTMILSVASLGYMYYLLKKQIETLEMKKRDNNEDEYLEDDVYQSWSGTFADGTNSLVATLVWKKIHSKQKNDKWVDWDGLDDDTVVNRNFYLGNESPSFDWTLEQREFDTKAIVKETFTDGWDSLVQLKLVAFVKEPLTSEGMNSFLRDILRNNQIDWQKVVISKREVIGIFG